MLKNSAHVKMASIDFFRIENDFSVNLDSGDVGGSEVNKIEIKNNCIIFKLLFYRIPVCFRVSLFDCLD